MTDIKIVEFTEDSIKEIRQLGYSKENPERARRDGPYFEDRVYYKSYKEFKKKGDYKYLASGFCRCIMVGDKAIGSLSRSWVDKKTRWLEIGIIIYDENYRNGGYGTYAIKEFVKKTFHDFPFLEHVGLTTWSGNIRMMKAAEKAGFKKEGQIRKVRYWKEVYYDSVKYGILREEMK